MYAFAHISDSFGDIGVDQYAHITSKKYLISTEEKQILFPNSHF